MNETVDISEPIKKKKTKKKRLTASHVIAFWMLAISTGVSAATIYLMYLCVRTGYMGGLAALCALITFCQVGTATVLAGYFSKSKAENTSGGITYDMAMIEAASDFSADTGIVRDA